MAAAKATSLIFVRSLLHGFSPGSCVFFFFLNHFWSEEICCLSASACEVSETGRRELLPGGGGFLVNSKPEEKALRCFNVQRKRNHGKLIMDIIAGQTLDVRFPEMGDGLTRDGLKAGNACYKMLQSMSHICKHNVCSDSELSG